MTGISAINSHGGAFHAAGVFPVRFLFFREVGANPAWRFWMRYAPKARRKGLQCAAALFKG